SGAHKIIKHQNIHSSGSNAIQARIRHRIHLRRRWKDTKRKVGASPVALLSLIATLPPNQEIIDPNTHLPQDKPFMATSKKLPSIAYPSAFKTNLKR
ncbi:MAG: hypothetical protein AAF403_01385, partial [Pseudomonadota bacterium]